MIPTYRPAGLLRRLAAGAYDLLLLAGLLMAVGFIVVVARGGAAVPPGTPAFSLLVGGVVAAFYTGFWRFGGQTLGMRAWRLRVETADGGRIGIGTGLLRLAASLLSLAAGGLGFLWIVVDPERQAWHDRLSGTRVVLLPKRPRQVGA